MTEECINALKIALTTNLKDAITCKNMCRGSSMDIYNYLTSIGIESKIIRGDNYHLFNIIPSVYPNGDPLYIDGSIGQFFTEEEAVLFVGSFKELYDFAYKKFYHKEYFFSIYRDVWQEVDKYGNSKLQQ